MQVREAETKDNKQLEKLIKKSLESFELDREGTAYFDPQLSQLAEYYQSLEHAKYWVVIENEEVVGGIGIAPLDEEHGICELQKFYVRDDMQGRGLGRKLIEVALCFAKEHYRKCYLETRHELQVANVLYEKAGFIALSKPLEGSEHSAMDRWYLKNLID